MILTYGKNNEVVLNPHYASITEFLELEKVYRKGIKYEAALSVVYLMVNTSNNNAYLKYKKEERFDILLSDFDVKPSEFLTKAINKYKELYYTPEIDLIEGALMAAKATGDFFRGVDYNDRDARGNMRYNPKMVMDSIKSIKGAVAELGAMLKTLTEEESVSNTKMRGKESVSDFEKVRPDRNKDRKVVDIAEMASRDVIDSMPLPTEEDSEASY